MFSYQKLPKLISFSGIFNLWFKYPSGGWMDCSWIGFRKWGNSLNSVEISLVGVLGVIFSEQKIHCFHQKDFTATQN